MQELEVVKIFIQMGAFGVLAWLVWQQNTKAIPAILERDAAVINQFIQQLQAMVERDQTNHQHEVDKLVETQELIRERIHQLSNDIQVLVGSIELERKRD